MDIIYEDIHKNGKHSIYYHDDHYTINIPYQVYDFESIFRNDKERAIKKFWEIYNEYVANKQILKK